MSQCEVVPVRSRRESREFIEYPYQLYKDDPWWVPPLRRDVERLFDTERHPFHAHADVQRFLARKDGRVAGRIAAIVDRNYNGYHGEKSGFFGFFESIDEDAVAAALLDTVHNWVRERGAAVVRGPMNPSTNYECGLLVEGFLASPFVMMPYNPDYYAQLLERAGWRKAKDLYAYTASPANVMRKKVERVAGRALKQSRVQIRAIRMQEFETEVERIWAIYNSAWGRNWGFVPVTREEFLFLADEMKPILAPGFVLLGEVDGQPVGFALALPDINRALKHAGGRLFPLGLLKILYHQRKIRNLRVLTLGVVEKYLSAGLGAAFYAALIREATRLGYGDCEFSWVLEDNVLMKRSMEALGARRYKVYRIYERT